MDKNNEYIYKDLGNRDHIDLHSLASYTLTEIIRFITICLERDRPGLVVIPYRNLQKISDYDKQLNVQSNDVTIVTNSDYDNKIPDEMIAWRIRKQRPTSRGAQPFTGTIERKPTFREYKKLPDNSEVLLYGRGIDSLVGFTIFAKNSSKILELRDWLRHKLIYLSPAICGLGAQRFYWLGFDEDPSSDLDYTKPYNNIEEDQYFFRTEDIYVETVDTVLNLLVDINLNIDESEVQAYKNIVDNWIQYYKLNYTDDDSEILDKISKSLEKEN